MQPILPANTEFSWNRCGAEHICLAAYGTFFSQHVLNTIPHSYKMYNIMQKTRKFLVLFL